VIRAVKTYEPQSIRGTQSTLAELASQTKSNAAANK
jgi:hypothetical protein